MPNFSKKCKKQLRRIFLSKIFSCVCSKEIKDQSERPLIPTETAGSENLETLLLKTLKHQLEERQYQDQLKNTLLQITQLLEQVEKNYDLQRKLLRRFSNDGFSKFTVTVSKDNLIHCQTDVRQKSLMVLNERNTDGDERRNSVVLHKCRKDVFHVRESILPKGSFSSAAYKVSDDKAVQYDCNFSVKSSFLTDSKLIQTRLLNSSNFNVTSFKVNLVKQMRNLKHDVVTLRQLLYSLEYFPGSCRLNTRDVAVLAPNQFFWKEEFEYKFFEAKIRAANFVKFYKLRKAGEVKKKNKCRGGGRNSKK